MPRRTGATKSEFAPRARITPATLDRLLATAQRLDTSPSEVVGLAVADFVHRMDYAGADKTLIETSPQQPVQQAA